MDFSIHETKAVINLCDINTKLPLNYSKLANIMGFNSSDKRFVKIKKFLIEHNVIEDLGVIGSSRLIKINNKRLIEEIPEINFVKFLHENFIKKNYKALWVYN